jgi:hypothetical protein
MADKDKHSLWILEPVAPLGDAIWQDRIVWSRVAVVATSEAFARLAAEEWAYAEHGRAPGNESPTEAAGFRDEKLYGVKQLPLDSGTEIPESVTGTVVASEKLGPGTDVR